MTSPSTSIVRLDGGPIERARAQIRAAGPRIDTVRAAMLGRLGDARALLARDDARRYLTRMREVLSERDPAAAAEIAVLADGYGLSYKDLFDALHLAVVADHCTVVDGPGDGCTAWAALDSEAGAILAKNRDYGGRWPLPPAVFRIADPAWGGRTLLCVGSFGAPGAYSSGINDDGLALADTQIGSLDNGVGLLRYFVMTDILANCVDVDAALARMRAMPHCGGGSLVLADRHGAMAAVELGHSTIAVDRGNGRWVARTNHFTDGALADKTRDDARGQANSLARLRTVRTWLEGNAVTDASARVVMSGHDGPAGMGLCRHGDTPESRTISSTIFRPQLRAMTVADGTPCSSPWDRYQLDFAPPVGADDVHP